MRFTVEGIPAPQGSKSAYRRGNHTVLVESSKKVKPWRKQIAEQAKPHFPQPLEDPIVLRVVFIMPRTKAMKDKTAPPMVQKPDLDKLLRALCDGLTGVAFNDDSQVIEIQAGKRRAQPGESTGAEIEVVVWEEALAE